MTTESLVPEVAEDRRLTDGRRVVEALYDKGLQHIGPLPVDAKVAAPGHAGTQPGIHGIGITIRECAEVDHVKAIVGGGGQPRQRKRVTVLRADLRVGIRGAAHVVPFGDALAAGDERIGACGIHMKSRRAQHGVELIVRQMGGTLHPEWPRVVTHRQGRAAGFGHDQRAVAGFTQKPASVEVGDHGRRARLGHPVVDGARRIDTLKHGRERSRCPSGQLPLREETPGAEEVVGVGDEHLGRGIVAGPLEVQASAIAPPTRAPNSDRHWDRRACQPPAPDHDRRWLRW